MRWLPIFGLLVLGCGAKGPVGSYKATVEPLATADPAKIESVRKQLDAEPETMAISADGTFKTTRGANTLWEGKWRMDGGRLVLRSTRTLGVDVLPALQLDKFYTIRPNASIVDDTLSGDGYILVYVKQ